LSELKYNQRLRCFVIPIIFCFTMLVLVGCSAGTWENDSKNWQKAFGSSAPDEIAVVNSFYWQSAHFTLEFEYFFEIETTDVVTQELIEFNQLTKVETGNEPSNIHSYVNDKPIWFVPKELDNYDIYTEQANRHATFKVFIDRETGHVFLTENQL